MIGPGGSGAGIRASVSTPGARDQRDAAGDRRRAARSSARSSSFCTSTAERERSQQRPHEPCVNDRRALCGALALSPVNIVPEPGHGVETDDRQADRRQRSDDAPPATAT